jgi:ATP-dependent helicase YprA (DUF1998 family)/very-short-patch-repair endonuclease
MDVFDLRERLVEDYADFTRSFVVIRDDRIADHVDAELRSGVLWPNPVVQLNPAFESGGEVSQLVKGGLLDERCTAIFARDKTEQNPSGTPLSLHKHQREAIELAQTGANYVLTTGTGSGKSLAYIVPIVDRVLRTGPRKGIKAIVIYPMNALANSQMGELEKFLNVGPPGSTGLVTFRRYTGQEGQEERDEILQNPPDILLTNYVMLELILTRPFDDAVVKAAQGLEFLVLDELHTYRGRQGADVAMLVRRVREACHAPTVQCIGTSATLAGGGGFADQQKDVATLASLLFGAPVSPEHVIGETLRRATKPTEEFGNDLSELLRGRLNVPAPSDGATFLSDPLASWIETTIGLASEGENGRLKRAEPRPIHGSDGMAKLLADTTGALVDDAARALQETLLQGNELVNQNTGFPLFAFKLHQFFSRGETVYATLESPNERQVTLHEQQFAPGSERSKALLPLAFCRECGQEYYTVRTGSTSSDGSPAMLPRRLNDTSGDDESDAGFLYLGSDKPWPADDTDQLERVPDEWLEPHGDGERVKTNYRKYLPRLLQISPDGKVVDDGLDVHWIPAPFRFCLRCGVSHGGRQPRDFGKLLTLGAGGRSSATTILSLATVRSLRHDESLDARARKLLSFTDNRQDASLQAGHFNDFVEVGLTRSALYRAALSAGSDGIAHDELAQRVFAELALPFELYAVDPTVRFGARQQVEQALRDVLAYRLYRDLERGWRITAPNLEQCGLLEISYLGLDELAKAQDVWDDMHPALALAAPEQREQVAKVLLDLMRRELAIRVDYLDAEWQERLKQRSSQFLVDPWAVDEQEDLMHAAVLYPRPRRRAAREYRGNLYVSARGGFGQFLKRPQTFPAHKGTLTLDEIDGIIQDILDALRLAGLVVPVSGGDEDRGYQLAAAMMRWLAGDGTRAYHDTIRVPSLPEDGGRTNPFFVHFYKGVAADGQGLEAREHTAQVPADERVRREDEFRVAKLPVLYCSPTMELGVDIAELNVVNMRNVPPTPANYAQRSGRAGRSGQPALVFNYAAAGSAHDQYFFRRPQLMVSGQVKPPRIDLTNEDLVRAHIHAVWLAETGAWLGSSLAEIIDVDSDDPDLPIRESKRAQLEDDGVIARARPRVARLLESIPHVQAAEWWSEHWLEDQLTGAFLALDRACDRWRELYRAAVDTREAQHGVVINQSRPQRDRDMAKRLRAQAEAQIDLLRGDSERAAQSDFNSYRYFASEGFLPGYNFPRLPLSAFIPARRGRRSEDEFVQRPRFLAISEFGPRSIIYHEGSRYLINRVFLPAGRESDNKLPTDAVKQCSSCGYLHPVQPNQPGADICEYCGAPLNPPLSGLFRLQNVSTKRRDRINSDEEERVRMGFELRTGIRFAERDGRGMRIAHIVGGGTTWGKLAYGGAATLWRINLGWTRRKNPNQLGFLLDTERGYWAPNEQAAIEDQEDPGAQPQERVVPYVEDRRNALLFEPASPLATEVAASIGAALKSGIQVTFDLEDSELQVEPLPGLDFRRQLLFYESAEGGAGVLRQLADDPDALPRVARASLELCHFDPDTGQDLNRAAGAREDCVAACYDCLLSYGNQRDHLSLDRHAIRDLLLMLRDAEIQVSPGSLPRAEQVGRLIALCDSELERRFVAFLDEHRLELPTNAQERLDGLKAKPDFTYAQHGAVIFVDGPPHNFPDVEERDRQATERLEDAGYHVIRVAHDADWSKIVADNPSVFGDGK